MADSFTYQKKRKEFGRHGQFEDTDTKIVGSIPPDPNQTDFFMMRDPNTKILSNLPVLSQHFVNTERTPISNKAMSHKQGGWPENIDHTEAVDVQRYEKNLYRDTSLGFSQATKEMVQSASTCIRQNNEIDLFEEYFHGESAQHLSESITTKTLMIFKDPNEFKRSATSLTWHPEVSEMRLGVTYAMLRFQQMPHDMPKESYIWNLNNPNFPEKTLLAPSPLTCMAFNHKNADIVVGGCYDGSLSFFDTREGNSKGVIRPVMTTFLENSHHDPVYGVSWVQTGKQGNEAVSLASDGQIIWWDRFNMEGKPKETYTIVDKIPDSNGEMKDKVLGGTALEYLAEAGPLNYLIGSEQGYICLGANRKKQFEIIRRFGYETGKHHGPVYSLWRNPAHTKNFMSVGDWQCKIWHDDLPSPIMQTRYHSSYLTDGCWSPQRCGLFYLTRIDGFLDVWDFYYRQNEVAYSQKISDCPLTSISVNQNMAAIGDSEGTVSIMQLCPALYETTAKEKEVMFQIFEREFRREKNLMTSKKLTGEAGGKDKKAMDAAKVLEEKEQQMKENLVSIEEVFFKKVSEDDDLDAIKARAEMNQGGQEESMGGSKSLMDTQQIRGAVELEPGKSYVFKSDLGDLPFTCEAGGVIQGENITGQVQAGKVIFTTGNKEIDGTFTGPAVIQANWTDGTNNGAIQITMHPK